MYSNNGIFIRNLSKSYGNKRVLTSITQDYKPGLVHGIVGANGSGKTTFFNCLTNNISHQGEVFVERGLKMGYLPTELFMYPRITGMEFIEFCLSAKGIKPDKERILSFNKLFELPLNEYAESYSTGMLKKLYLLVLVIEDNDILILDEPFNGLDVSAVSYICELLIRIRSKGKLLLVSSHIIDHLGAFCDTMSLIENEKLMFAAHKADFSTIEMHLKAKTLQHFDLLDQF